MEGEIIPVSATGIKYHFHVDDRYGDDDDDGLSWPTALRTVAATRREVTIYSRVSYRTLAETGRFQPRTIPRLWWRIKARAALPGLQRRGIIPPDGLRAGTAMVTVATPTGTVTME